MRIIPTSRTARACALAAVLALPLPAAAQSVYGALSTTGASLGYAHRASDLIGARAEVSWLPSISRSFSEDGIDYSGDAKSVRGSAMLDMHPFRGGFRLTVGLSFVNAHGDFTGAPSTGSTITIGGATVPVGPADSYTVRTELPRTMPYVGIGWGGTQARGWGFHADVGVLIGSPKVTGTLSPSLRAKITATGTNPDTALSQELQTVQDTAADISVVPVVALGVSYRW